MFKLIILFACVAYASAGLYSGWGSYGYGLGHGAAYAPAISYAHAPIATSYANTYKVAVAPALTKVVAPAITKVAYAAPAIRPVYAVPPVTKVSLNYVPPSVTYAAPAVGYGLGYGLGYGHGYGLGYGHGYGYGGYGH